MVVVSHLFLFLWKSFRGRCDSYESHLPPVWNYLFPDSPSQKTAEVRPPTPGKAKAADKGER